MTTSDGGGGGGPGPSSVEAMRREVLDGLAREQKELSPKFFYDERGSRLFEAITRLPEYYPTRIERELLERWVPEWVAHHEPATLVELGAGSARKTEIILDAMTGQGCGKDYVPVDVSGDFLEATGARIRQEYPSLDVEPLVADMTVEFHLAPELPRPVLFALLGSTLGNFPEDAARDLLGRIRSEMGGRDIFLLGADLRAGSHKSPEVLEAAYNDPGGVTADFNLNVLRVLNRELGADFEVRAFRHRAFYDETHGRIEMHLESLADQSVEVPGGDPVILARGETIRTEISAKYDRDIIGGLVASADMEILEWEQDPKDRYALILVGALP